MSKALPKGGSALCYVQGYEHPAFGRDASQSIGGHMRYRFTAILALALTLGACDTANTDSAPKEKSEAERLADDIERQADRLESMVAGTEVAAVEQTAALPAATLTSVCKALIANRFGHPPSIMTAKADSGGIVTVSYNRPDDGKRFTNDCRIDGDSAVWRSVNASPGSGPGPWRDRPEDEKLTYAINGKRVFFTITYSDGSVVTESEPMV